MWFLVNHMVELFDSKRLSHEPLCYRKEDLFDVFTQVKKTSNQNSHLHIFNTVMNTESILHLSFRSNKLTPSNPSIEWFSTLIPGFVTFYPLSQKKNTLISGFVTWTSGFMRLIMWYFNSLEEIASSAEGIIARLHHSLP